MKKLLVLLVSAMLVLSLAAVSMASVEVTGDFRYVYTLDSAKEDEEELTDGIDLRLEVLGQVSDTVSAYLKLRNQDGGDETFKADEYFLTFAPDWATFQVGYFDWSLTPSVDIITANGFDSFPRTNTLFTVDVPFGNGFSFGIAYVFDGNDSVDGYTRSGVSGAEIRNVQDGAYDLKLGYANELFGGEVHYSETKTDGTIADDDEVLANFEKNLAINVWYQALENLQIYALRNDPEYALDGSDVDAETVVGFYWSNIAATPFGFRAEYNTTSVNDGTDDYHPYGVRLDYTFGNGLILELEHLNYNSDDTTTALTAKVLF